MPVLSAWMVFSCYTLMKSDWCFCPKHLHVMPLSVFFPLQGTSGIIHEPCFHSGYLRKINMSVFYEGFCARRHVFNLSYYPFLDIEVRGTGNFQQCQQGIIQLFNSSYCPYSRCSFNGVFLPPLQGQFGVSL